jgi:cupin 2 domain-containing protein
LLDDVVRMVKNMNLFDGIDRECVGEQVAQILASDGVRIERIVSHGESSPPGFWYDQAGAEWVVVLAGSAGLVFEDEAQELVLRKGESVFIAPHRRHRVAWTDPHEATLWLAVHWPA